MGDSYRHEITKRRGKGSGARTHPVGFAISTKEVEKQAAIREKRRKVQAAQVKIW